MDRGGTIDGEGRLADRLRTLLGSRHPRAAVAVVTKDGTATASVGTHLGSDFEIGSVSKGVTGLLYADAIARGEVSGGTALGEVLPLRGTAVGAATLSALSTHRSGLPSLPATAHPYRRTLALYRHGTNPYGEDVRQLLDQARNVRLGRPRPRYSNLGFELLGHSLAAAAGTSYAALLGDRVARPLGLDVCYTPGTPAELRPEALVGTGARGRPREPWTGEAIAPAGGIRATVGSMARLTAALLDGTAPGIGALDPVATFRGGARVGAGWVTVEVKGRGVTWHNGGTGGFRSWLGLDRDAGTGVVILSATSVSVDRHGFALLAEQGER